MKPSKLIYSFLFAMVFIYIPTANAQYLGNTDDGFALESICVTDLDGVGSTPLTLNAVAGETSVCEYGTKAYSISTATGYATNFVWTVPTGATITTGQGSNNIIVTFGNTSGDISVLAINDCDTISISTTISLSACNTSFGGDDDGFSMGLSCVTDLGSVGSTPLTLNAVVGETTVCEYTTKVYTISIATGYAINFVWTLPAGATLISGQGSDKITVTFGNTSGNISVLAMNSCDTISASTAITLSACNTYLGNVDDGFAMSSLCFMDLDGAGTTALTIDSISGNIISCASASGETYTTNLATGYAANYVWTVPVGATITSGQGSNTIVVSFGTTSGDVTVEAIGVCETAYDTLSVTINDCPIYLGGVNDGFAMTSGADAICSMTLAGASTTLTLNPINGPDTICQYETENYTISTATGYAVNFVWTVPVGATIISGQGSSSINVTFGNTNGDITVQAINNCEIATDTVAVILGVCNIYLGDVNDGFAKDAFCNGTLNGVNTPLVMDSIAGSTLVCEYSTLIYTSTILQGSATNYFWRVPAGASVVSGQGSSSITVTMGTSSGDVTVEAINACESAYDTLPVVFNPCNFYYGGADDGFALDALCYSTLSGAITPFSLSPIIGPTSVCEYETENYSTSIASGYALNFLWTIPTGAVISTGQGSLAMVTTFGNTSGNIDVLGINACGTAARSLAVALTPCNFYFGGVNEGFAMDLDSSTLNGLFPLSIELLSFNAVLDVDKVLLDWTTFSEINNDYFTVEKTLDPSNLLWDEVDIVGGAGSSDETLKYETVDFSPYKGISYYRLKQTDFDGSFTYSKTIAIDYQTNDYPVKVYPNITENEFFIEGNLEMATKIELYDNKGKLVFVQKITTDNTLQKIVVNNLPTGLYLYKITINESDVVIGKIVLK